MEHKILIRRMGLICCHCLRNIAFYITGWQDGKPLFKDQFFVNANGNFLDISVLEWCKLFGDPKGVHYWKNAVADTDKFYRGLLQTLEITDAEFYVYIDKAGKGTDLFSFSFGPPSAPHLYSCAQFFLYLINKSAAS